MSKIIREIIRIEILAVRIDRQIDRKKDLVVRIVRSNTSIMKNLKLEIGDII